MTFTDIFFIFTYFDCPSTALYLKLYF